jgi:hypothetical protein
MSDHVHMLIAIPPRYAVSQASGVHIGEKRDSFGAGIRRAEKELCRATLLGTRVLRVYRRTRRGGDPDVRPAQEQEDRRLDQLNLGI